MFLLDIFNYLKMSVTWRERLDRHYKRRKLFFIFSSLYFLYLL